MEKFDWRKKRLQFGHDGKKIYEAARRTLQRMAAPFWTIVAIAGIQNFFAVIAENFSAAFQNENYFARSFVRVESNRGPVLKSAVHDFDRRIGVHFCDKIFFAALEICDNILRDFFKVNFHKIYFIANFWKMQEIFVKIQKISQLKLLVCDRNIANFEKKQEISAKISVAIRFLEIFDENM